MKTVSFVGYLLLSTAFVFLLIQGYLEDKSWSKKFTVKKTSVVQESVLTQNSPFFVLNNRK